MPKDVFWNGFVGYGELSPKDIEFLRPDYDAKRQQGQRAVGMYATADKPQVVNKK